MLCAVVDTAVVKYGPKDLLVAGLEDGTVAVLDLTGTNGNSYRRPVFKMKNETEANDWNESPHSQFQELSSEHEDSIVSVEANIATVPAASDQQALVLSASKDGYLYVWRLH